ncbi:uncharacterized protein N7477_008470 [Penicillium maclennaniae]|uniref:uncharacterized protein n=1 Tax=Penicillium maclennaniae TaxID=1343394 RepID=UPI0025420D0F|nr:uncharacterized protein N7477_008470 [Penicillium maclennaniae]KAJ5666022.1 hypothetical protein N7477_008470 [Penicillium maclennaniae]
MAYNLVAQVDEVASHSGSDASRSPSPTRIFHARDTDTGLGPNQLESARVDDNPGLGRLGSLLQSMSSTSYDMVEAEDYDVDPCLARQSSNARSIPPLNTTVARHSSFETPLRSAASDLPTPLSHPTPDLQSIQGAYKGNVERLEMSAERLSLHSADIGSEIRRMDLEQKRRSCSSASNSIKMRNGAFSPGGIASPIGSTISTRQRSVSGASRLAQVTEPEHEGHFLDNFPAPLPILPDSDTPVYAHDDEVYHEQYDASGDIERPGTAASGDTYQKARTLFTDFDGVHFAPLDRGISGRQLSLTQPPLASKPEPCKEPRLGEHMVYYPAPVPRMLNLPPKLSRKPIVEREKRRMQLLTSIVAEDRKAEAWHEQEKANGNQKEKRPSTIPPQLRASVFFESPSQSIEVDVKQDSAVATLDSILDASANAPVSAFTDHPYAGQVGSHVYTKSKRNTIANPKRLKAQNSQLSMGQHQSSQRGSAIASDDRRDEEHHDEHDSELSVSEEEDHEDASGSEEEDDDDDDAVSDYVGPPNTLLAELELRKQELKQRQRTFVPKPTPGMTKSLLELDAMAQMQSEKRRRRPVTLAWDSHNADDEDVPLALLYPEKSRSNLADEDRPVGLMEQRQFEENEPLSSRRARLRGEPVLEKRPVTMYSEAVPPSSSAPEPEPATEPGSDDEGETLAERLRRLRGQKPTESEFAHDLLAEIDSRVGIAPASTSASAPVEPVVAPEEETLAQRRARLQKESGGQQANVKNPRMRRSMAALPRVRPRHVVRQSSHDVLGQPGMMQYGNRMSMQPFAHQMQPQRMNRASLQPSYAYGTGHPPVYPYNMGMNGMVYPPPGAYGPTTRQPIIDPNQADVIDRWRQSVRY